MFIRLPVHSMTKRMWATLILTSMLITHPMTNRKWVTLHSFLKESIITSCLWSTYCGWCSTFVWKAIQPHLVLWPTECKWHYTFSERQESHHILSYDQQKVSGIAQFCERLITSCPMTNSLWVTLSTILEASLITWCPMTTSWLVTSWTFLLLRAILSCLVLWPTESELHCTLVWMPISSHLQQAVSEIALFCKANLTTSCPITNRKWVTLHFLKGNLITSCSMTNRKWACGIAHFCERQSCHILTYDKQAVSGIG